MLILTRRPAESIHIGEEIVVTVLAVVGNQVRFGIEAPKSVTIDRAEVRERKQQEKLRKRDKDGNVDGNVVDPEPT